MIPGLSVREAQNLIMSVGTHQPIRPLNPVEVGEYCQRALDGGISKEELAQACLLQSTSIFGRFIRLSQLSSKLTHLVTFGNSSDSLSFTQAMEIARLPDRDEQEELAYRVLENRLSKDEVRSVCQILELSKKGAVTDPVSVEDAVDRITAIRTAVEHVQVVICSVAGNLVVRAALGDMTQAERDDVLSEILEKLEIPASGHLSFEQIVLVPATSSAAAADADGLEKSINNLLGELLGG